MALGSEGWKMSDRHKEFSFNFSFLKQISTNVCQTKVVFNFLYMKFCLLSTFVDKGGSGVAFKAMKAAYVVLSDAAGRNYYNAKTFPPRADSESDEDEDQDVYSVSSSSSSDSESDSCASCASKAMQIEALKRKVALLEQQLAEERRRSSQSAGPSGSQGGTRHERSAGAFECGKCHKKFSSRPHLKRHDKVCSKANPMACPVCAKIYFLKEGLKRHMDSRHQ